MRLPPLRMFLQPGQVENGTSSRVVWTRIVHVKSSTVATRLSEEHVQGGSVCKAVGSLKYRVTRFLHFFCPSRPFCGHPMPKRVLRFVGTRRANSVFVPTSSFPTRYALNQFQRWPTLRLPVFPPSHSPWPTLKGRTVAAHDLDATPYALSLMRVIWIPKQAFNSVS